MLGNFEKKKASIFINGKIANHADYSAITSILICDVNTYVTLLQKNTLLAYTNLIGQNKLIPIHNIVEVEDQSEDIVLIDTKHKQRARTQIGKNRFTLLVDVDIDYFIQLKKLDGIDAKVYLGDINGNLVGYSDGVNFKPITIDSIIVKKINIGSNKPAWTGIIIDLHDADEINYTFKPSNFSVDDINLEEVFISSITTVNSTTLELHVADYCGTAIDDLIASNFTLTDNVSGALTTHTFTNLTNGNYRIKTNQQQYSGIIRILTAVYFGNDDYSFVIPQYNPAQYNNTQYSV